jgi:hypothetical protein
VNQFQAQARRFQQHLAALLAGRRASTLQQVVITAADASGLPPAPANLKAAAAGQFHHLLVAAAIAEGGPQARFRLSERYELLELGHLVEKLLQLLLSHGLGYPEI